MYILLKEQLYDSEEPDEWLVQTKMVNAAPLNLHPSDSNSTLTSIYPKAIVQSTHCRSIVCLPDFSVTHRTW